MVLGKYLVIKITNGKNAVCIDFQPVCCGRPRFADKRYCTFTRTQLAHIWPLSVNLLERSPFMDRDPFFI